MRYKNTLYFKEVKAVCASSVKHTQKFKIKASLYITHLCKRQVNIPKIFNQDEMDI